MKLAPAPWGTAPPYSTEDDFWRLPDNEKAKRIKQLHAIPLSWSTQTDPAGLPVYEALQPPMYYWISSLAYRLVARASLLERVFILRYLAVFICSSTIPIIFLIARRVSGSRRTAILTAVLFSLLPELMINIGRVGNECLGIFVFSWLTLLAVMTVKQEPTMRSTAWTGVALGIGLLTKAYFLTALPALVILYVVAMLKSKRYAFWLIRAFMMLIIAFMIAGWWYVRNRVTTGSWSGLLESAKLAHYTLPQFWQGAKHVNWRNAIDSILLSHIWFGAWSSLQVRSWIYHIFFLIILAGMIGVGTNLWQNSGKRKVLFPLLLIYVFFWCGQLYNVLLLFLTKGASTSMGWYMYCVVASEITLVIVGLESLGPKGLRNWAPVILIFLVGVLDLYSVHLVSIPYYTGLTSHSVRTGAVPVAHLSRIHDVGITEILNRLSAMKPSWLNARVLGAFWATYVLATLTLIGVGCFSVFSEKQCSAGAGDRF